MIPKRDTYEGQSYHLYDDYNDIHVFIEDLGFENLYTEIFRRYGVKIRKVFSKNGKNSVIEAARACEDERCVFVIDRDWDDVLNINHSIRRLIVLDKHSIENYLLDYSGFYAVVLADNPRSNIEILFSSATYISIVAQVSDRLRPLFECFLAMQECGDGRHGCSQKPGRFQEKNRSCAPSSSEITAYISEIGIPITPQVKKYFKGDVLLKRGHGKYMLHFIWNGVRALTGSKQKGIDKLMIHLAQGSDSSDLRNLCDKVIRKAKKRRQP